MSTFNLRMKLVEIARRDVGKVEVTTNRAPWIKKLWEATNYPDGMANREPYCAAGMAYCLREWGKNPLVLLALGMTAAQFEKWRCKSASVFRSASSWVSWAKSKGLLFIDKSANLHAGDMIVYKFSHIEMYVDDSTALAPDGIICIGYNTSVSGSRDGDGCEEAARTRSKILHVIRILP